MQASHHLIIRTNDDDDDDPLHQYTEYDFQSGCSGSGHVSIQCNTLAEIHPHLAGQQLLKSSSVMTQSTKI